MPAYVIVFPDNGGWAYMALNSNNQQVGIDDWFKKKSACVAEAKKFGVKLIVRTV
jgi:hypothetical protein